MQPGWNMWEDVVASFWVANGTTKKKIENKIHRGLRRPPTNKLHTTINKSMRLHQRRDRRGDSTGMEQGGGAQFDHLGNN
jgi:hypothetical protein